MRGLLSGIGLGFRDCEYILGTSAGSIVAATLVSGRELDARGRAARAGAAPGAPAPRFGLARAAARAGTVVVSPLAPLAFAGLAPPGRLARSAVLPASPRPHRTPRPPRRPRGLTAAAPHARPARGPPRRARSDLRRPPACCGGRPRQRRPRPVR